MRSLSPPPPPTSYSQLTFGRMLRALLSSLCLLAGVAANAQEQMLTAESPPQCWTVANPDSAARANAVSAIGSQRTSARSAMSAACGSYAEFAPHSYDAHNLPLLPVKTVRIMFHIMQKDDGSENFQSPAQDGGVDEAVLRGLVNGSLTWPLNTTQTVEGVNNIYRGLNVPIQVPGAWPNPVPPATLEIPTKRDTRIQFQIAAVRYYRYSFGWNMSNGGRNGCNGNACGSYLFDRFVRDTNVNPGTSPSAPGQVALTPAEQDHVIHLFLGENPGPPGTSPDPYGVSGSRYGFGGVFLNTRLIMLRGYNWTLYHHPLGSPGSPFNPDPLKQQDSYKALLTNLAHELGHSLGLLHTFPGLLDDCVGVPTNDPILLYEHHSNNIMDNRILPGYSLSQCQIGRIHTVLSSGVGLADTDDAQVRDHWTRLPGLAPTVPTGQDVVIAANTTQTWNSIHNLRGDLYVQPNATLTINCRVGFLGPVAKIVVRQGGHLILDGGIINNYATSDRNDAPQALVLQLGGNPATTAADLDNTGLITIRNSSQLSRNVQTGPAPLPDMQVRLAPGASLHLESSADLVIDNAHLTTLNGSFLCVDPGASVGMTNTGTMVTDAGTTFTINPVVVPNPSTSCVSGCNLSTQVLSIASTIGQNNRVCSQPLTLTVSGLTNGGYIYAWSYRTSDNPFVFISIGTNSPVYSGTTPNNTTNSTITVSYYCTVSFPGGSCPSKVLTHKIRVLPPTPTVSLLATSASLCIPASGYFDLAALVGSIFPTTASYITGWVTNSAISYVAGGFPDPDRYLLNTTLVSQSTSTYVATFAYLQAGRCPNYANITLTLLAPPALTIASSGNTICPNGLAILTATPPPGTAFPAGTSFVWQPGGQTGATCYAQPSTATTYTVTATNAAGCTSRASVRVDVRPADCPVCAPAVVAMNPVVGGTPVDYYSGGYTFVSGTTYYFSQSTRFDGGHYVVQEKARLVFTEGVYLTLSHDACLEMQGGTLTATCDVQWGGIILQGASSCNAYTAGGTRNEISHSRDGIQLRDWYPSAGKYCKNIYLNEVQFLHNLHSFQLPGGVSNAGDVTITDCLFDSAPTQMLAPFAYVSPTEQYTSLDHLTIAGDAKGLTLEGNAFRRALFGIWAPDAQNMTVSGCSFESCYIAGAVNYHPLSAAPGKWVENDFKLPPRNNAFNNPANLFVAAAYAQLAAVGGTGAGRMPTEVSAEGNSTGLVASGEPLMVVNSNFSQAQPLPIYEWSNIAPQIGLWAGAGTVYLTDTNFGNLHLAYASQAQQSGGIVTGCYFYANRTGAAFFNRDPTTPAGAVALTCNTFAQPATGFAADVFGARGLYLGPAPIGTPGNQVDLTIGGTLLQTNAFTGKGGGGTPYWHVFNDRYNTPFDYTCYTATGGGRVADDAVKFGDDGVAAGNPIPSRVNLAFVTLPGGARVKLDYGNDCTSRGYPTTGLQARSSGRTQLSKPVYLTQNAPNPCSGSTSVSYRAPDGSAAQLIIRDTYNGRIWHREALDTGEHTVELNLYKLPPGAYIYTLELDGRAVAHHRLLVQ